MFSSNLLCIVNCSRYPLGKPSGFEMTHSTFVPEELICHLRFKIEENQRWSNLQMCHKCKIACWILIRVQWRPVMYLPWMSARNRVFFVDECMPFISECTLRYLCSFVNIHCWINQLDSLFFNCVFEWNLMTISLWFSIVSTDLSAVLHATIRKKPVDSTIPANLMISN